MCKGTVHMNNQRLSQTDWHCLYHLAFVPRVKTIGAYHMVKHEVAAILQMLCRGLGVDVLLLETGQDYVYMRLSIPPWRSALRVAQHLKDASSAELLRRYPGLAPAPLSPAFWIDGCLLDTRMPSKQVMQTYISKRLQTDWAAECRCAADSV